MSSYFSFEAKHENGTKFSVASYSRSTDMYRIWEEVGVPSYAEARVITPEVIREAINVANTKKENLKGDIARTNEKIEMLKDIARGAKPDAIDSLWESMMEYKDGVAYAEEDIRAIDGIIYELYTWSDMIKYENEGWTFYGSIEGWLPGEKPDTEGLF